jgi:hypothetical protein
MLGPMDIPTAAAGTAPVPWLVLGVVLGVLLVLLAGLTAALVLRRRAAAPPPADADEPEDDLPGFLESPPGSGPGGAPAPAGWAALTATPAAAPVPVPTRRGRRDTVVVLAAMAVTAALLIGTAAVVAATSRSEDRRGQHDGDRSSRAQDGAAARLTFGGVVLEPRAVGVTATYPVVEITVDGDETRAQVEFPTFNCLSGAAPADPVAAGCTPAVTEYADLTSPDLVVSREGAGLRVSGRFPTELRPNGSAPVPTGRVYDLEITAAPADGEVARGWRPAEGVLHLGQESVATVAEPGVSVIRSGS